MKATRGKLKSRSVRNRKLLWRKLSKIKRLISSATSPNRLSKLLQAKWDLEFKLKSEYTEVNAREENEERKLKRIKSHFLVLQNLDRILILELDHSLTPLLELQTQTLTLLLPSLLSNTTLCLFKLSLSGLLITPKTSLPRVVKILALH